METRIRASRSLLADACLFIDGVYLDTDAKFLLSCRTFWRRSTD